MEHFRFYRSRLSPSERAVYRALEEGMSKTESEFSVPRLPSSRLSEIAAMLRLDNPMLFHFRSFKCVSVPQSSSITVKMSYTMKKAQYEDTAKAVRKRLDKILAPCTELNEEERELFIHDYLVRNVVYERLERPYSHEVTGPLCHGIGVCEGIAKSFKLMCDELSIPCLVAVGRGVAPERKTGKKAELHAWNIVYSGKIPYGVDVTFDLAVSKDKNGICYNYYNVPDSVMMRDHSDVLFPVVPCRTAYDGLCRYRRIKKI